MAKPLDLIERIGRQLGDLAVCFVEIDAPQVTLAASAALMGDVSASLLASGYSNEDVSRCLNIAKDRTVMAGRLLVETGGRA